MKQKRIVALLMATFIIITSVACSKQTNEGEAQDFASEQQTEQQTEQQEENTPTWTNDNSAEISILVSGDVSVDSDNIVLQEIEKQTNTNIDMIYTARSDEATKRNALITAGDVPDIFSVPDLTVARDLKKKGLLADLTDVLNEVYPEIFEEYGDELAQVPINDDGIYLIPNFAKSDPKNISIREDWLENLGFEMPADLESYAEVVHAFTYDDPDQNGVDDTYGINANLEQGYESFIVVFGAYGIPAGKTIELEDGTVTTWVKHEHFLEAMKYIKGLFDDGVVTPDYMAIPKMTLWEDIWNGKAGVLELVASASMGNWVRRYTEDPKPIFGDTFLTGPYGDSGVPAVYPSLSSGCVVAADCKNLEGVARIIKLFQSLDGNHLLNLGVEDVMYQWIDKEKGIYERLGGYTDDALHRQNGAHILYQMLTGRLVSESVVLPEAAREMQQNSWENGIDWPYIIESSSVYSEYGADMDQIISEMWAELVQTDVENMQAVYDEYIAEWEAVGGSDWEVEVTGLWKAQNE